LPLLRSIHPGVDDGLIRFAHLAAEDDALLSGLAREALGRSARVEPDGLRIPVASLAEMPLPLRRRLYLAAWERAGCPPDCLEARHLEAIDCLKEPGRAHRVAPVPGPGAFVRSYDDLWALIPGALDPPRIRVRLAAPGRVCAGALGLSFGWAAASPAGVPRVAVPAGRGRGGLVVRTWRPGDRVDPGTGKQKKVKDILMEGRVPYWRRRRSFVVADDQGPLGLLAPDRGWYAATAENSWVWLGG
jgi:tRNA(Ile)-lysidine synthase